MLCMAVVSFRLFCKNLGNLQEFFGQMDYRDPPSPPPPPPPPWQKIARTPMAQSDLNTAGLNFPTAFNRPQETFYFVISVATLCLA